MAELLPIPEVAAGATEVVVAEWLVKPGDSFAVGDLIAVIETEKAVVELPAERAGTLLKTLVDSGSQADVGSPMALVGDEGDLAQDVDALLAELGVGAPDAPAATPQPPEDQSSFTSEEPVATATETAAQPETGTPANGRTFVSPIARKLLREAGVSSDDVAGTGPNGRIRRRDVEAHLSAARAAVPAGPEAPAASERPAVAAIGPWTDVPHSRLRRAVARRLTESKQQVPHFYVRRSVTLDAMLALRAEISVATGTKVSVNDLLVRAMAVAHTRVPDANVIWTDDAIRRFDHVDISVAIASERGLVTPVLRSVESSSVSSISSQVRAFVEKANEGRLQQQDLEGGSITISNLGMFGVDEFSAIINPPQSAILAVGAGRPLAIVEDGEVVVRTVAELVLSVDHRAVDGALAAQWMAALVDAIHAPLTLLV